LGDLPDVRYRRYGVVRVGNLRGLPKIGRGIRCRSIGSEAYPLGTGTPLLYNRSHHVYLGTNARFTTERFLGHMDEVAIYQTPLTSDEINGLYHAGIAG
jgi:hypothetical protein